jgi:transcriptional regulator with XRE-family HTH domain
VERALLSSELKKLRIVTGETQEAVAAACEWSVAKLIRIENGTFPVRKADLEALLRHYGVEETHIDELAQRAREARAPGWWEDYDFGNDKGFEAYVGYEDGASVIRMWQPLVIPGLLQTPEYTLQTMEAWGLPAEVITQRIRLLQERRKRVAHRQPRQMYILDEAAIRRPVGSTMPDQLRYLVRVGQQAAVTIHVVPFSSGPHFGLRGPFILLSFDGPLDEVLYLESAWRGDLLIADTEDQVAGPGVSTVADPAVEVAQYHDGWTALLGISLDPDASLAFIDQVASELS